MVTEADVKEVLINQRAAIIEASNVSQPGQPPECHPNYLAESANNASTWLDRHRDLQALVGEGNYQMLLQVASSLPIVARSLHNTAVDGHIASGERFAKRLIAAYVTLLKGIAEGYNELSRVGTSGLEGRAAEQQKDMLHFLAATVAEANALFSKSTTAEFLGHVKGGAVDSEYRDRLVAKALGNNTT